MSLSRAHGHERLRPKRCIVDADINDSSRRSWERTCVTRAKAGDAEAFGEIYDAHAERLYRRVLYPLLGNAAAAEDALAETFRVAFQRLDRYQPGEVSIYHWLAAIARNKGLDMHRARKVTGRALANFESLLEPLTEPQDSPEQLLAEVSARHQLGAEVQTTLGRINARYREAIALTCDFAPSAQVSDVAVTGALAKATQHEFIRLATARSASVTVERSWRRST